MLNYNKDYCKRITEIVESVPGIEDLRNKTIFITGANGLVCSPIVDILHLFNTEYSGNIDVVLGGRAIDRVKKRFPYMSEGKDYRFIPFDSFDLEESLNSISNIKEINYIIHGAGTGNPASIMANPVGLVLGGVLGLKGLLDVIKEKGGRLLFVSSSEAVGPVDTLNPRSCYPESKRVGEVLIASYKHQFDTDGVIGRPGHIYGPAITDEDNRVTAEFTRNAKAGEKIVMKSLGEQVRSYCYFLDCASGLLTILLRGEAGKAYNISNPDSVVSIGDMARGFSEVSGCELVFDIESEEERKKYNQSQNLSIDSRELLELGWKPLYDRMRGIEDTLEFFDF